MRGAIQTLAARGIVEVSQGARTRVVSSEVGTLKIGIASPRAINSYDLDSVHAGAPAGRAAVVAEAAARIDDDDAAPHWTSSLAAQKRTLDDPVRFLICDREFHIAIYHASPQPRCSPTSSPTSTPS